MTCLHLYVAVPHAVSYAAFRAACAASSSSPQWTEHSDDPSTWSAPPDAAGGLVLWGTDGSVRAEPSTLDLAAAVAAARDAIESVGLDPDDVRAAYFSSGGQGVFLLFRSDWEKAFVYVARPEEEARLGWRGEALQAFGSVTLL